MLALILLSIFGLSSGFFIARAFKIITFNCISEHGIIYFSYVSIFFWSLNFLGTHQNFVPYFFVKEPFTHFYDLVIAITFFFSLAVTRLVQSK